jgi:hypothetical protein
MPAIDIDREAAYEAAQRELAKPIYPRASLNDRIAEWVNDLMFRLMHAGAGLPGGWFTIAVLGMLFAAAVIVAVRIARRTMGGPGVAQLYGSRTLSADDHRARAERSAAQGDWAPAIRQRLRAIGRQLEEDGVLDPVPGRTAGELCDDAGRALPGFAADLAAAAAAFDDVTYGERPGTEPNYRLIAGLDDRVRSRSAGRATDHTAASGR